ncbi:cupin domain-containing protein [Paucibacter sp. B2R-40]|uniref:cupin domain-containing protein n=1 Tax=Paucibacter sp. B2R-40 TaxID=2893554 RepID=UPI0021E370D6|nr:cupin domain-containing protein [Paucibacter sp. B2R-40]MCV2356791.1 cupin domain-containing protein [Paucibacter sp. B2R-40]
MNAKTLKLLAAGLALLGSSALLLAQVPAPAPALSRTVVATADVSVPNRQAVIARVEVAPGGVAGWHTHPGDEMSYVMEGEAVLLIAGQAPRHVAAGQAFVVPAGVVHSARNEGGVTAKLVGVYVVEKGQPLASPASAPSAGL